MRGVDVASAFCYWEAGFVGVNITRWTGEVLALDLTPEAATVLATELLQAIQNYHLLEDEIRR